MRIGLLVLSTGLFLFACRSDSGKTPDAPGGGDASGAVTIQMVQNDAMPPGTPVSLAGVIVTAIDSYGAKTGDVWVEEPEGGPFSGVHVFKADTSQVAQLQLGDIVSVTGAVKSEFALTSDTTGRTVTELEPAMTGQFVQITKTGSGTVPPPMVVDALAIGMMTDANNNGDRSAAWEMWEGVLITVNNVSALSAPKCVGSACSDPLLQQFGATGDVQIESSLAAFPTGIIRTSCLASVTGVEDYFFDYLILPRSTGEVTSGGTACPAPEAACSDGVDNDGNGFLDCGDNNCIITDNTCHDSTVTIAGLNTAATLPTGGVNVGVAENVYVTAISSAGTNFWVSSSVTGAANKGLEVFAAGESIPTGVVVGSKVSIIGKVQAFNNDTMGNALNELDELQTTKETGSAAVVAAPAQSAATLTVDATGKPMVGTLVQMANVAVVDVGTTANHGTGHLKQGGVTFESLPDIIGMTGLPATEMGKCYLSITGIWSYDVFNNAYALIPLAAGTGTGSCN